MNKERIKSLVSRRRQEIIDLLSEHGKNIQNNMNYKTLLNILSDFWRKKLIKEKFFAFFLKEEDIDLLNFSKIQDNLITKIQDQIKAVQYIELDNEFNIVKSMDYERSKYNKEIAFFKNISKQGYIVFFFGELDVDAFINGECENNNIFYSEVDRKNYYRKKDISDIENILSDYNNRHLSQQDVYSKFFLSRIELKSFYGQNEKDYEPYKQTLKNKPETFMQNDLKGFLNQNLIQSFVAKEVQLSSSKKRLDITTEYNNRLYFFEIKWIGNSINNTDGRTTSNDDSDMRAGVKQTIEYIKECIENEKYLLGFGMLVIFDARENNTQIDYQQYNNIPDELFSYKSQFFKAYDKLIIKNTHPH